MQKRPTNKTSWQHNSETCWRHTTETLLGFSFDGYRRGCRNELMGRCGYVPPRRLCDVPLRCHWVFYLRLFWDVLYTYWWNVVGSSSWDVVMRFQQDAEKMYNWDVLATFHRDIVGYLIWDVPAMSLGRTEIRQRYTWQQPGKMCLSNVLTHSCIIIHYIVEEKTFFSLLLTSF